MKADLFLRITHEPDKKGKVKEDNYSLDRLAVDPKHVKLAWRFRKPGQEATTVMVLADGRVSCDCQAATYHPLKVCKHRIALVDRGLLPKRRTSNVEGRESTAGS